MNWLRRIFGRRRIYGELSEEIRAHLDEKVEELVAGGMPREEAAHAARRGFGNVMLTEQRGREVWRWPRLEDFLVDLRYALRMLRKSPGFASVAVLTLALGIGANAAIFSVVNGVLLRPLPFPQPNRLVTVTDLYPKGALEFMRASFRSLDVAGYRASVGLNLTGVGQPVRLYGDKVSANFFAVLGVQAELGRTFVPGEDQLRKDGVVILSHALWEQRFGGDPKVVGRVVNLEGRQREIVGVMPAGFQFGSSKPLFWAPLEMDPRAIGDYWGGGFMPVIGSLRPGATLGQARAELWSYLPRMRKMFPWQMPDAVWASSTVAPLQASLVGGVRTKLLILLGAVGLVLLMACANVANLLLERTVTRQKEIALRAALGAGGWRICRQVMTESLLLGVLGGTAGVLAASGGLPLLKAILLPDMPRLGEVSVDWRVVAFATGLAILTGLLFGVAPAMHVARVDMNEWLKTGGRHSAPVRSQRLRAGLAVTEVAMAVVLVTAAGLLARSLWELSRVNPGFRTESIVTARITPSETFCANWARCRNFYDELVKNVRGLPGVDDAATVNVLPLTGRWQAFAASLEDHPQDPRQPSPVLFESIVSLDFFGVMGIPVLEGRGFIAADLSPGAPAVALITESTARKFWPNQDAVGKHFKREWLSKWSTVVGVVGDVNEDSLASKLPDYVDGAVYEPYGGNAQVGIPQSAEMTLVVRANGGEAALARELRGIVSSLNPDVPLTDVRRLGVVVSESEAASRSTTSLFVIFAALALALGAIGIYGVISYSVAQRTSEIGMRIALGAQRRDVLRLVAGQAVGIALRGVIIGLAGALAATRLISSLLFGVSATDPLVYGAVAVLLTGVALLACYVPARRAMRVDPMTALRSE
ncbi:MAG: ABC transporter permease [Acidobacteriota bacterium]|nr:ABC transporter permease [Acidobacteriota bacterium]